MGKIEQIQPKDESSKEITEKKEITFTLKDFLDKQKEEMLSDDNMHYAGEKLKHSPSNDEAAIHYVTHGGAKKFREKYGHLLKKKKTNT